MRLTEPYRMANSVDSGQTALHCLPKSICPYIEDPRYNDSVCYQRSASVTDTFEHFFFFI